MGVPSPPDVRVKSHFKTIGYITHPGKRPGTLRALISDVSYACTAMFSELVRAIERGADIVLLAAGLLRLCREHLAELHRLDGEPGIWRQRETLRRRCEEFFRAVDDEELDAEEQAELCEIALGFRRTLPGVIIAHTIAEALDLVLGSRFLPMFMGRQVVLEPGDPIPVPHSDWRRLADSKSHPGAPDMAEPELPDMDDEGERLDATAHLRLASDWAGRIRVTLDGNWRRWHVLPQLQSGERVACAVPNQSLAELVMERDQVEGVPVFLAARWGLYADEQLRRCLALLDLARDQGCRIVVFPELSVAEPARQHIRQWLEAQSVVDLVVAGSSHCPAGDGAWHNEVAVYLRGLPDPMVHRKFQPLTLLDPVPAPPDQRVVRREHLARRAPELTAQLSPHWTMVVLAGVDAVAEPVPAALVDLRASLVLVPALGVDAGDVHALATALATHCRALTLVASACVADEIGAERPPLVIGLPSPPGVVRMETPPARFLLVVTIGSLTAALAAEPIAEIVECPDTTGSIDVFPKY
jgi:hypothetical protein